MKVIDLLNKIANGEEVPKKIKFDSVIYIYDEIRQDYYDKINDKYFINMNFNTYKNEFVLNRKVEIPEEENEYNTLREENQKLKELCDKYEEEHNTIFIEWQKDINIIDELEKWLIDNIEYGDDDYYDMKAMGVESALNKLKELKGSDKE